MLEFEITSERSHALASELLGSRSARVVAQVSSYQGEALKVIEDANGGLVAI